MSKKNTNTSKKKSRSRIKIALISLLAIFLISGLALATFVFSSIREVPRFDAKNILNELNLNSNILDEEGNLVERIHAEENREIVYIDDIPTDIQNAFIAIEDERFLEHGGVDIRGIFAATIDNIKAGTVVRGASTITQQLAKNVYLSSEVKLDRKIKEAYIAMNLEDTLSKDQILEAYLNSIYLGQGAYGIKDAAEVYFSKELEDLTLAESAVLAGITKNPSRLPPYIVLNPNDIDESHQVLGELTILGEPYFAVFNPESIERQELILEKMNSLGFITDKEYTAALEEDISKAIVPGRKDGSDISSYFVDYVKDSVLSDLVEKGGYTEEDAERMLLTGGLNIYSTIDVDLQMKVEDIYDNFNSYISRGKLSTWRNDSAGNIISANGSNIIYYSRSNILDSNNNLFFNSSEFTLNPGGDIVIDSRKLTPISNGLDVRDYYSVDNSGNLLTHALGSLAIGSDYYSVADGIITISSDFLEKAPDFYSIEGNTLTIGSSFFSNNTDGIMQPQSATVLMEQSSGKIKTRVGGRNTSGQRIFNRATSPRQVGSSMKPLGAYLPALDSGYTAATGIDDSPIVTSGKIWPNNYDHRFRGFVSLRDSVKSSINVSAVKTFNYVGAEKSMEYLEKMGIINNNGSDTFITKEENPTHNDENPSALALGGLSRGISPLKMTGAYASIANEGTHIEPRAYVKVEDRNGVVILDNTPSKTQVVSPQTAYVMTDILKSVVSEGTGGRAAIRSGNYGIPIAGKTGTTSDNADAWFTGYSPYYTGAVWIGNDSLSVKLTGGSAMAAEVFSSVMKLAHEGFENKDFSEPEGIVRRTVCTVSGKLVSPACSGDPRPTVKTEIFASGTEPTTQCDLHVSLAIDTSTGLLASDKCPLDLVSNRTFLKRSPAYDASAHGGIYPEDYQYAPPSEYCDHIVVEEDDDEEVEEEVEEEDQDQDEVDEDEEVDVPEDDESDSDDNDPEDNDNNDNNNDNDNNGDNGNENPDEGGDNSDGDGSSGEDSGESDNSSNDSTTPLIIFSSSFRKFLNIY